MEIVLKTVDACNNKCKYCFYFGKNDRNLANKDQFTITRPTIDKITEFLKKGCKELNLKTLSIIFHGGEPLLQGYDGFEYMCKTLFNELNNSVKLHFGLQTNGTLISEDWIKLFKKYHVNPSISIDGYKECHDNLRVDYSSRGTYEKVADAIRIIKAHKEFNRLGSLSVINPNYFAKKIYRHFVDDLQLNYMDFLLPDINHDTYLEYMQSLNTTLEAFGDFLCDLFDEWVKDDNPYVSIRIFKEILLLLSGHKYSQLGSFGPYKGKNVLPVITIFRDGRLAPEDNLKSTNGDLIKTGANIANYSLAEFVKLPIFDELRTIRKQPPTACRSCLWVKVCNGGDTINQYSKVNGFNNPSVYCSALKCLYKHIANYMLHNGFF